MRAFKFLFMVVLAAFLAFSCSDKKDNPEKVQEQPPEQISAEPITLPQAMEQSVEPHVMMIRNYVQMLNYFQQYASSLIPRQNVGKISGDAESLDGPPWVYTWQTDSLLFKLTITIENDQYHWKFTLNGTSYGHTFNNYVYMEAWQSLDGKSGRLVVHAYEEENETMEWTWNIDANGTETINFSASQGLKIQVVQQSDLSGTLKVWQNNTLVFEASWNAAGSGTWTAYDENGNQTASGSWS